MADINAAMLQEGRRRLVDAGIAGNVTIAQVDAEDLPFADATFDRITIAFGLRNVTDKDAALRSMHRVLKPGGQAWIFDPARVSSHIDARKWKSSFTLVERILYVLFLVYARINPGRVYSREQVISMAHSAGFREVDIRVQGKEIRAKMVKPAEA